MKRDPRNESVEDMLDDNSQNEQSGFPSLDFVRQKKFSTKGGMATKTREEFLRDEVWNGQDLSDFEDNEQ